MIRRAVFHTDSLCRGGCVKARLRMRWSLLQPYWRAALLLSLSLLLQCGDARVLTEAPAGPLYRAVGAPLSIACRVSGFSCETCPQDFQFRVVKPSKPNLEMNIISTNDRLFGYAVYQDRSRAGDIAVTRTSPSAVVFEIRNLKKEDEGEYDCSVVNSEYTYAGTYSVKTTVKVIEDSLSVSAPASTSLSFNEGEALTLTCQASSNTIQHTHLSFAWFLHKDGEDTAQPVISLDRDFALRPGRGFEERHRAGRLRLDKLGEATYRLEVSQLELSDQGRIHCGATEWIQDPDNSWYPIAGKDAEEITLEVKAREVKPDTAALAVRVVAQQTSLQEGQELVLPCSVDALNPGGSFFSVAWLRGGVELARIGPTGVLTVGPEYSGREKEGELRAARTGTADYRLILRPVRTEDQGEYRCRAWPQERGQDGVFTQGAAQDSSAQLVSISATESGLSVAMQDAVNITEGGRLSLSCKVEGVKGQLSVTWQYRSASAPSSPFANVVGLSREGVAEEAEEFRGRRVRATRPAADVFVLELDEAAPSDGGVYQCAVSEWQASTKVHSQSQAAHVTVSPLAMTVSLISRNNRVTVGQDVDLMCRVRGPRAPMTLTWSLQGKASTDDILTVNSDGAISWSAYQHRYQLEVENKRIEVVHHLRIVGASRREAGTYQCRAFLKNAHRKLPASNPVGVVVQNPDNNLVVSSLPSVRQDVDTDVEIRCSVTSRSSASSLFAVTWLLRNDAVGTTLLSSDRNAVLTLGPALETSDDRRISVRRTDGPSFVLTVRRAQTSDAGTYNCTVDEWLQDPHGDWYQLATASAATELDVTEPEENLVIAGMKGELNVSLSQDFTVPCHVVRRSSDRSAFQVTWFWREGTETTPRSFFTVYRNATFRHHLGDGANLSFLHPLPNRFSLVLRAGPRSGGLYSCTVEEWLPSASHGWRRVAEQRSETLTVSVSADGRSVAVAEAECTSVTLIAITVAIVIVSLVVISALALKICKSRSSKGKKTESLWVEEHVLKASTCD